jgi:hypothetical protein
MNRMPTREGTAWTNRMREEAVRAPKMPAVCAGGTGQRNEIWEALHRGARVERPAGARRRTSTAARKKVCTGALSSPSLRRPSVSGASRRTQGCRADGPPEEACGEEAVVCAAVPVTRHAAPARRGTARTHRSPDWRPARPSCWPSRPCCRRCAWPAAPGRVGAGSVPRGRRSHPRAPEEHLEAHDVHVLDADDADENISDDLRATQSATRGLCGAARPRRANLNSLGTRAQHCCVCVK